MTWRHLDSGERHDARRSRNVFLMTGADPNTRWLDGCLLLDDKGFVKTGADLLPDELATARWPLPRRPYLFETSLPGVFASATRVQQRQARRLRGRRGLDLRPARAPRAAGTLTSPSFSWR